MPFGQAYPRIGVSWNTAISPSATVRGTFTATQSNQVVGALTNPTYLIPGNGQTPLPYNICGYYAVQLADLHAFRGDSYEQFREYRIKSFRISFTSRMPMWTGNPGGGTFSAGPDGTEVMLVNTSKTGQFILPFAMSDTTSTCLLPDSPWFQVMNYPSVRNIAKITRMSTRRMTKLSMKVDCTEDYIRNEDQGVTWSGPADVISGGVFNGVSPQESAIGAFSSTAAGGHAARVRAGRFQMGRRRFRWTKQWLLFDNSDAISSSQYLFIRNDTKAAHGVQFMVRELTYWQSTVPYFNVSITAQIEFRGRLLQRLPEDVGIGESVLFPYTTATFGTTL